MKIYQFAVALVLISMTTENSMAIDTFDATNERAYSIPTADAPELAALGPYTVGVTNILLTDSQRPNIAEALAGRPPIIAREITAHIWYPSISDTKYKPATYSGRLPFRPGVRPPEVPENYELKGIAHWEADIVKDKKFPLVVLSHGYGNWSTFLSYLAEYLASKGYIVASIGHGDLPYIDLPSFNLSFANTMLNRSRDQHFAIEALSNLADFGAPKIEAAINTDAIGLIGYSMGGFGALATAGAGYDSESPSLTEIPRALLNGILEGTQLTKPHPNLKAVIAIAPWGGAPANRAWTKQALAKIKTPLFVIAGDQDDVSGFDDGIRWVYDNATGADRHMLIYQNGRHSIGGNPEPPIADDYFDLTDWFNEPVWRRDRVVGINQHFITAFLNLHLKKDASAATFMNVSPERSNDGQWPIKPGGYVGGAYSGGEHDGKAYWKGFQRRFALGLTMKRASAK